MKLQFLYFNECPSWKQALKNLHDALAKMEWNPPIEIIDVETDNGRVLLSGFVDNDQQREQAVQVASAVSGVVGVKNGLTLR